MDTKDMIQLASRVRAEALKMIHDAGTGHTGGALSVADILTVLYADVMNVFPDRPDAPERDRFFLSKGHSCEAYYALLADLGFFPRAELCEFSRAGARLIGHPNNRVPGVEVCTGALGHGLPGGRGRRLRRKANRRGISMLCRHGRRRAGGGQHLGGRNGRRELQAGQFMGDCRSKRIANKRINRGGHGHGRSRGQMASLWLGRMRSGR